MSDTPLEVLPAKGSTAVAFGVFTAQGQFRAAFAYESSAADGRTRRDASTPECAPHTVAKLYVDPPVEVLPSPLAIRRLAVWLRNWDNADRRLDIASLDEIGAVDAGSWMANAEEGLTFAATGKLPERECPESPDGRHTFVYQSAGRRGVIGELWVCQFCPREAINAKDYGLRCGELTPSEPSYYHDPSMPDPRTDAELAGETTAEYAKRMMGFPRPMGVVK